MMNVRSLLTIMGRPIFLVLNGSGVVLLFASQALPGLWSMGSATVGSAFLTIGVTLPIALYFQVQSNAEAFKILNTCTRAGIDSIFISRKQDSKDLREAITDAISSSTSASLLGIAFRTFSDPSGEGRDQIAEKINSPSTRLRVLLLDPESEAAQRRATIELGNATIDDIRYTLNNNLVSIAVERLRRLRRNHAAAGVGHGAGSLAEVSSGGATHDAVKHWREKLNMEVRTYTWEPTVFLMVFDTTMFVEQYHRGRPDELVPVGSCIGKYMPVAQYRHGSAAYRFLGCHFETIWKEAKDRTEDLVKAALNSDAAYRHKAGSEVAT
jgi:hypothetical protein